MKLDYRLKKVLIIVGIVIVSVGLLMILNNYFGGGNGGERSAYVCEDGSEIAIQKNGNRVQLFVPGYETVSLRRTASNNGDRYQSSDDINEFWDQGGEAIVKIDGVIVYDSCLFQTRQDLGDTLLNFDNWNRFTSSFSESNFQFTISHPSDIVIDQLEANAARFSYGQPDEGLSFEVTMRPVSDTIVVDSEETKFLGYPAEISVSSSEGAGPSQQDLVVQLDPQTEALIRYQVIGSDEPRYNQVVSRMLNSLMFSDGDIAIDSGVDPIMYSQVSIALLNPVTTGATKGCDQVVFIQRDILATNDPLNSAMKLLFAIKNTEFTEGNNFIPNTANTLRFDRAVVAGDVAHIFLEGSVSGRVTTCDDDRAQTQIVETALQIEGVESVQLYNFNNPTENLSEQPLLQG